MAKTPEGLVKEAICQWLAYHPKDCPIFWINESQGTWDPGKKFFRKKNSPYQLQGVADILGIWKGRPLAIEVKAGKGRPSKEQTEFLTRFCSAGGIAICAWGVDDIEGALFYAERSSAPGSLRIYKGKPL